jgi:hypothetical protein
MGSKALGLRISQDLYDRVTALGEDPIANVNWRYQWLWLYGFVYPQSG